VGTIGADPIHRVPSEQGKPGRDVPGKSASVLEAAAG